MIDSIYNNNDIKHEIWKKQREARCRRKKDSVQEDDGKKGEADYLEQITHKIKLMNNIKQRRVKVADHYGASGYGRGQNKKNVYKIDGNFYAYHPKYAEQEFKVLGGELKGYIEVKEISKGEFYAC